jgi:hypothetical protein
MFSSEVDKKAYPQLDEASLGAFGVLLAILERSSKAGLSEPAPCADRQQHAGRWFMD